MTIDDQRDRRLRRLREELLDEQVPVTVCGPAGDALIEEIDYARRPPLHEGVSPRFGALIVDDSAPLKHRDFGFPAVVDAVDGEALDIVRRLADGRTSFIARGGHGAALVCFDRTIEHEATAVQAATSAEVTIVQRLPTGWVRVFAPHAVITWDGSRWWSKPLAGGLVAAIGEACPAVSSTVVAGLAELCVHWLSAGRVGALLVWQTDPDAGEPGHLGVSTSITIPPLDVTRREHFAAVLNVLAQTDRAALVTADGRLDRIGVSLRWSAEAGEKVASYRGTRHTSARRFSYDEPSTLILAVSSAGPVSVFHGGRIITVAASTLPTERSGQLQSDG